MSSIKYHTGDITKLKVDAIVNAANSSLLGGGGVDGAIHRAAGPELLAECRTLNGCRTGEAKITKGYKLPAKHVIHTVGPIYSGRDTDATVLRNCYWNSLETAKANDLHSIAFPGISTGVYGYPKKEAAVIALKTVREWLEENSGYDIEITIVNFSEEDYVIYQTVAANM
ncbi:O-acetyl-ADP-ribose deacetylase [Butyrivibrio sp. WCD3002]|uniref:O-acetyl-ADP-ribose deacetylase n=1 Tax=Butyrivibrio sp. WCD3002 TaxID=1280676 RepID=UPI0003FC3EF3|nr:O-acetyl-ADP-ribose deacetylase [Butyrivibrio sp. WCD3002]